jgi:uncharacterized phage protein gp47/JayE
MNYGITPNGFNTKDFTALKKELIERWEEAFGDIDASPDGAFGQIADSLSYAHSEMWAMIQTIYLNMNPNTATDSKLARLLALVGMTPLPATKATVDCLCGGQPNITLPIGSSVARSELETTFALSEFALMLGLNALNRFEFTVTDDDLVAQDVVRFKIKPQMYAEQTVQITVSGDMELSPTTSEDVAEALVTEVWNNAVLLDVSNVEIHPDNAKTIIVTSNSPFRTFGISGETSGTFTKVWKTGKFTSINDGVYITPPHTVTNIKVGTSGWTDVDNLVSGTRGSDAESDNDMRRRLNKYKQVGSTGSKSAIESKIWQNVEGVANVIVNDNNTDYTNSFRAPPHSVHCIVDGGESPAIAKILAENVPAGIATFGKVSESVDVSWTDTPVVINFDRINSIFGWIKVTVTAFNDEENLPANAEELIRTQLFNDLMRGNVLGGDVITQKYVGSVYKAVQGLQSVTIECAVTGVPTTNPNVGAIGKPWDYDVDTYSSGWQTEKVIVAPYDRVEWRDGYNRILVEGLV